MSNPNEEESMWEPMNATASTTASMDRARRSEMLRTILPACQPQEGSPANTFTESELQELQAALQPLHIVPPLGKVIPPKQSKVMDITGSWEAPTPSAPPVAPVVTAAPPQKEEEPEDRFVDEKPLLDWHGAPTFASCVASQAFRNQVRAGAFTTPTNGVCPGQLQCNLVVLPAGQVAFDFLLFCQRNPQSCPLLEVCEGNMSMHPIGLAVDADLRTDCPKYAIYRNGKLEKEVTDVSDYWPEQAVSFLIGCSFSYDGALMDAGIPLRSAEQGKNVPMFKTNLKCRSAGSLHGHMVVSMKPIPALQISKHVEITSKYKHAHAGPVCIGRPDVLGIPDMDKPDWGDAIDLQWDEVPVFHACGVTPQAVLQESQVPFAITHAAGHMFVTDRPADMGVC